MSNTTNSPSRLTKRNLFSYSLGTIGRDAACAGLFMGNILNYVYFTKRLDATQFAVLTFVMAAAKIFDAFNDLIMGNIIDATKSRFGKFKPWIAIGMITSAVVVYFSFANDLQGWAYVTFFALMYFAFSITFTMNDISYWGMIPALAREASDRDKITSLTVFCAGLGNGVCGIVLPILTTGDLALGGSAVSAYRYTAVVFVFIFVVFQSITLIGVKEDKSQQAPTEKVSVKAIITTYKRNDQLRWIAIAFFLTQFLLNAALTIYIYFQFGYNGTLLTLFFTFSAISSVFANMFFPKLSRKYSRAGVVKFAWISMLIGGLGMLVIGVLFPNDTVSFVIPVFGAKVTLKYFCMALIYFFVGFGQTITYMAYMICIANTTEYNDYKFGKRSEGVIFAARTFITKLGSALNTLIVMLFYIIIGINHETNAIADLEQEANIGTITAEQKLSEIEGIIHGVPAAKVYALLFLFVLCLVGTYTAAYFVYKKKYFIDEAYFEKITGEIAARNSEAQEEDVQTENE